MPDQTPQPRKRIDWHDVKQKAVTAVVIATLFGFGGLAWNSFSNERVLKLLGGVTAAEVEVIAKRIVNAETTNSTVPAQGAIVSFDGRCPPGWKLFDEAVGSAIVGYGATIVGETGDPLGARAYDPFKSKPGTFAGDVQYYGTKANPKGQTKGSDVTAIQQDYSTPPDYSQPISRYLPKVKTATTPTYLPLMYCKRDIANSFEPYDSTYLPPKNN